MTLLDRILTVAQAAAICGVPEDWLRHAAAVTGETMTLREALAAADGYRRDEAAEHRRLRRLARTK